MDSIIEKLREIVKNHPELASNGFIKGLDSTTGKIVVVSNGIEKEVTIDELEKLVNPQVKNDPIQNIQQNTQVVPNVEEVVEVMEEPEVLETIETVEVKQEPVIEERRIINLKDMQDAVIAKDENAINKAIEPFAIDNNGKINVNKAIATITDNSTNNVISCMRDNTTLPLDLSKYDITGKPLEPFQVAQGKVELNDLVNNSFTNIMVYVGVARLKNQVFNDEQIEKAKSRYARSINEKLNVLGLNKQPEVQNNVTNINEYKQEKSMSLELKPDNNIKKAGFADILILTIIVIIYAAIIINLVSKLN